MITGYLKNRVEGLYYAGGSFSDDFTLAGLGIQLGLGLIGVDFSLDVRDFIADVTVNRDVKSQQIKDLRGIIYDI